jgi:hypothetical protein
MRAHVAIRLGLGLLLAAGGLVALPADAAPAEGGAGASSPAVPQVRALSNRADLVSGGDVLVQIDPPQGSRPSALRVELNGREVTGSFAVRANGEYQGVLTGLRLGTNSIVAGVADRLSSRLTVTNHSLEGPIFSGPQIQPWYCLPGALDKQCRRPITYTWQYKSSVTGSFGNYDPKAPPSDVATTTTDQGKTVPYIVRIEHGVMDRNQYQIAMLYDGKQPFTRWTGGPPAWNHKIYEVFGGGCNMATTEGPAPDVMQDVALSKGFSVMSTAMSDNTYSCNIAVQAESMMMAKEHLIETYGDVRYLFGYGCSGGSIASLQVANAYPGLVNGVIVLCTMPDIPILDLLDCAELLQYFENPTTWEPGVVWPETQQAAAAGMQSSSVCHTWAEAYHYPQMFNPRTGSGCTVYANEPAKVYDPVTNPRGLRCSLQDYLSNILGFRGRDRWGAVEKKLGRGFAGRPYDNVGLQYGLRPLLAGSISPAQFVDLNVKVGSLDIDYNHQPTRVAADPFALTAAYRSGVIDEGNNLDQVPIIDTPGYFPGDRYEIHDNTKSWALRARLDRFNGQHASQVLWYGPEGRFSDSVGTMDAWLNNIDRDKRDLSLERKVVAGRPATARDACRYPDQGAVCDAVFGPAGNPRWAAGGNIAQDVVKCRLKPLKRSDYAPIVFTDDEWNVLRKAFPSGVCDWSRPGVSQQPTVAWQTYQDGPGGRGLGPPPRSLPIHA